VMVEAWLSFDRSRAGHPTLKNETASNARFSAVSQIYGSLADIPLMHACSSLEFLERTGCRVVALRRNWRQIRGSTSYSRCANDLSNSPPVLLPLPLNKPLRFQTKTKRMGTGIMGVSREQRSLLARLSDGRWLWWWRCAMTLLIRIRLVLLILSVVRMPRILLKGLLVGGNPFWVLHNLIMVKMVHQADYS
jgi:hypothetical protein